MYLHKGTAIINGNMSFGKADYVGTPVRIEALADFTQSAGERLVLVEKIYADATA